MSFNWYQTMLHTNTKHNNYVTIYGQTDTTASLYESMRLARR